MASKSTLRKWLILTFLVLGLIGVVALRAFWPLQKVKLLVSRATTYFTLPIKPDGSIDYFNAFNETYGAGHDPRDNMAIPLLEALGPQGLRDQGRTAILIELGLVLPDDGPYLVSLASYIKSQGNKYNDWLATIPLEPDPKIDPRVLAAIRNSMRPDEHEQSRLERIVDKQSRHASTQPWIADQSPVLADWLAANSRVLDELILTQRHSWFFIPQQSSGSTIEVPYVSGLSNESISTLKTALSCRATQEIANGRFAEAWQTAMTLCHFGRAMCRVEAAGDAVGGVVLREAGARLALMVAQRAPLTGIQARELLADYDQLPKPGTYMEGFTLIARIQALEVALATARSGNQAAAATKTIKQSYLDFVDVNEVTKRINRTFDAIDDAMSCENTLQRLRSCRGVGSENSAMLDGLRQKVELKSALQRFLLSLESSAQKRRFANDVLVCVPLLIVMHDASLVYVDITAALKDEFPRIALALAAFRAEHGTYPARLDVLSPAILPTLPLDLYTGEGLHYESDGTRYRFWSVDRDQRDDGGDPKKDLVVDSSGSP